MLVFDAIWFAPSGGLAATAALVVGIVSAALMMIALLDLSDSQKKAVSKFGRLAAMIATGMMLFVVFIFVVFVVSTRTAGQDNWKQK